MRPQSPENAIEEYEQHTEQARVEDEARDIYIG